ncbi:MAG: FTR1 family iron permease [Chloroflexi bacterium]|nr:FTR1 family iron permease [Chloroflexota bacterium]
MGKTALKWLLAGLVAGITLALASCAPLDGRTSRWDAPVERIEGILMQAVSAYEKGDKQEAMQLAKDAYFDAFESSGLEAAIRLSISSKRAFEVEYGFTGLNQLIRSDADAIRVRQQVDQLMGMIREDVGRLEGGDQGSAAGGFLTSFFIIVREGFEAILIIGALVAYLVKSGNSVKVRIIYQSAIMALLASVATAILVKYLFNISGASQELLEGVTMLLAVAVLFSVSFWLLGKVQAQKWQEYVRSKVAQSLTTGSTLALWSAAFLAVYREGAETVLFYMALVSSSSNQIGAIGLGLAAGAVAIVAIFIIIRWGSLKIPIKPFFIATGILLYYMAFVFAGKGIRELQEAGTIATSLIDGLSVISFLGIYPTWQGIALQSALLLVAVTGLGYQFLNRPSGKTKDSGKAENSA